VKRDFLRSAASAAIVICALATPAKAQDPFYSSMLRRGLADAQQRNDAAAVKELRIAAFGLVEHLPEYETAQIVAAVANERLGRTDDARIAAAKVVYAERLSPSYARLTIDAATRSAFEALLPKYVPADRLASTATFAKFARPGAIVVAPAPTAVATRPAAVNAKPAPPNAAPLAEGQDAAQRARTSWLAGDLASAVTFATDAISRNFSSGPAREILGNIAALERRWSDVVEHFTIARTSQRLTEDEKGKLFIGFVNVGRDADARMLRTTLAKPTLARPDVDQAAHALEPPAPEPRIIAPPAPEPQVSAKQATVATPQPRALTAQATPQPQPQPQPQPAARVAPPKPTNQPHTPPPMAMEPASSFASQAPPVSPLVAAARRAPSQNQPATDPAVMLLDADRLLAQGKIIAARETFSRVAHWQGAGRAMLLDAAKGLNQTSSWRESAATYRRLYPLLAGEELHMFHDAVNHYELGEYGAAKDLLRRALPRLPASRDVAYYRSRIEAAQ
jgi:hypothetical protein